MKFINILSMAQKAKYIPWLFDSRDAFEKTVNDPRYRYQMPFNQFMAIYNEYRSGRSVPSTDVLNSALQQFQQNNEPEPSDSGAAGQILTQEEIDMLIAKSVG